MGLPHHSELLRGAAKKVVSAPVDTDGCKRMDDVGQEA